MVQMVGSAAARSPSLAGDGRFSQVLAGCGVVAVLALATGCGGDDDDGGPDISGGVMTQPRADRSAAAVGVVSRDVNALREMEIDRACSLLTPLARRRTPGGAGDCATKLRRYARGNELLR